MGLQTAALGLAGTATTILTRRAARKAMYTRTGAPRLPRAARDSDSFLAILLLAAAAGAMLALADVLQARRKEASSS
ncbi:MAG TPA: hypothetical protein VF198_16545 [Vicinamibacterales bacterium]